jgi:riboflavin biosynthesis pyrimidine reductase
MVANASDKPGGLPWAQEKGFNADTIATVRSWQLERVQQFGNDVCLEYVKPSHHH